jgi:hypothetical protein
MGGEKRRGMKEATNILMSCIIVQCDRRWSVRECERE